MSQLTIRLVELAHERVGRRKRLNLSRVARQAHPKHTVLARGARRGAAGFDSLGTVASYFM